MRRQGLPYSDTFLFARRSRWAELSNRSAAARIRSDILAATSAACSSPSSRWLSWLDRPRSAKKPSKNRKSAAAPLRSRTIQLCEVRPKENWSSIAQSYNSRPTVRKAAAESGCSNRKKLSRKTAISSQSRVAGATPRCCDSSVVLSMGSLPSSLQGPCAPSAGPPRGGTHSVVTAGPSRSRRNPVPDQPRGAKPHRNTSKRLTTKDLKSRLRQRRAKSQQGV